MLLDFSRKLHLVGIIKQIKYQGKRYKVVNPLYITRGKRTSYFAYAIFEKEMREANIFVPRDVNIMKYHKLFEIV